MTGQAALGCSERRLIDRHFSGSIVASEEAALRAHLPACARCRKRYERHMLYAELVPGRPRMAERLAVGLGVGGAAPAALAPQRARTWPTWALTASLAAACLALLVTGQAVRSPQSEFGVRGLPAISGRPSLEIYRVMGSGSAMLSEGWMSARDELAFAYRNPNGFARLMVFGVDERGEIHWFHPAWTAATEDPVGVAIDAGEGPFELQEAIHHDVRGSRLRIVALFTNATVTVRAVEEGWRTAQPDPPGSARAETWLEVRP